jgi:hypothetical protein
MMASSSEFSLAADPSDDISSTFRFGARVWRPLNGSARENCFLEKGLCAETIRVAIGEYVQPSQRPWRIARREPRPIDSDGSTLAKLACP